MYNMKKNQIIITALVIMIVIAGYINYNDKVKGPMTDNTGVSVPVSNPIDGLGEEFAFDPVFEMPDVNNVAANADTESPEVIITENNGETNEEKTDGNDEEKKEASNEENNQPGAAVFVDSQAVASSYFSQVKLEREQIRAKAKADLTSLVNDKEASKEAKSMAGERLIELSDRMVRESQTEALIKAKGFNQVYVCIGETDVDVVVDKQDLTDQDIAKIMDAVKRKTNMNQDHIIITPYRKGN